MSRANEREAARSNLKLGTACTDCKKAIIPKGSCRCPGCGAWSFSDGSEDTDEVVRLSDAKISQVTRLMTLSTEMDRFFGGGLVTTSTCLIGGRPGCGKTTLLLQLADCASKQSGDRDVIYIANEQMPGEIRGKALEIGVKNLHQICIVNTMGGLKGNLFDLCKRYKPCLIILDSLTKLVGRDMDLAVLVAAELKALSVELGAPTFIINQVNKDMDHAGSEKLQHEVDMTCLIENEGAVRMMMSDKNRNGPAPLLLKMLMRSEADFARGRGGLVMGECIDADRAEDEGEDGEDDKPVATVGADEKIVKRLDG